MKENDCSKENKCDTCERSRYVHRGGEGKGFWRCKLWYNEKCNYEQRKGPPIYTAEDLGIEIGEIIYNNGKARMLTILETMCIQDQQMAAYHNLIEESLTRVGEYTEALIKSAIGDWKKDIPDITK